MKTFKYLLALSALSLGATKIPAAKADDALRYGDHDHDRDHDRDRDRREQEERRRREEEARRRRWEWEHRHDHDHGHVTHHTIACSAEVVNGNVQATERVLSEVSARPDFATATAFKGEMARIAGMGDSFAKAQEYLKLIDVDSTNKDQVVNFIFARDYRPYAQLLQQRLELSPAQADLVVAELRKALKGDLE